MEAAGLAAHIDIDSAGTHAYLALTRAAQVWRLPLAPGALGVGWLKNWIG